MNSTSTLIRSAVCLAIVAIVAITVGCHRQFEKADTNNNKKLEVAELNAAIAKALHEAGDKNGNGKLTYEEWVVIYPKSNRATFNKYDTGGTGLSLAQTTAALDAEGVFDKISKKIDTNGDGVIDANEAAVFHDAMEAADGENKLEKLENLLKS